MNNILSSTGAYAYTSPDMSWLDESMQEEECISTQQLQLCSDLHNASSNLNSSSFHNPLTQQFLDISYPQVASNEFVPTFTSQSHASPFVQLPQIPENDYMFYMYQYHPLWAMGQHLQPKGCYYGFGNQPPRCQAEGCNADLTREKRYHRRHKVCEFHSKAAVVHLGGGIMQRFCQQCSRFHMLDEFDDAKKSCRRRLADHNRRRRKQKLNSSVPSGLATPINTNNSEEKQEQCNVPHMTSAIARKGEEMQQVVCMSKAEGIYQVEHCGQFKPRDRQASCQHHQLRVAVSDHETMI